MSSPLRARLRLCHTHLAEHLVLRHQLDIVAPDSCRACRAAPETAAHVFLDCACDSLVAARAAVQHELRTMGISLALACVDTRVIHHASDRLMRLAEATASFLRAVRAVAPFFGPG